MSEDTPAQAPQQATAGVPGVAPGASTARGHRKVREGLVVSDKMDKTVIVVVEDRVKHPKYGKVMRRKTRYVAHDEENACGIGDRVVLAETRPLSATKRWRVTRIVEKAK